MPSKYRKKMSFNFGERQSSSVSCCQAQRNSSNAASVGSYPQQTPNYSNKCQDSSMPHEGRMGPGGYPATVQSPRVSFMGSTCDELDDVSYTSGSHTDRRINVRTLSLIVCTISYLLFGAAVFDLIESDNEEKQRAVLFQIEKNLTEKYNISEIDKMELARIYVSMVPYKSGIQWKFTGAFYFVLTVITTIGYGHAAPATVRGKVFCMFYAFLGIPLSLTVYQAVGERLNTFNAWWLLHAKSKIFHKPRTLVQVTQTELVLASWAACSIVLIAGAGIFSHYEGWSFFNSLYYCYITLTTIGFGDYIALQNNGALQKEPKYVFCSILYIMIALCVVASSINFLVLKFLTMNTMDEKESAQIEAQKQFSCVLRQVATENIAHGHHSTAPSFNQPQQSTIRATDEVSKTNNSNNLSNTIGSNNHFGHLQNNLISNNRSKIFAKPETNGQIPWSAQVGSDSNI